MRCFGLRGEVSFEGVGLHSGRTCGVTVRPFHLPGIWFSSGDGPVPAHRWRPCSGDRRTHVEVGCRSVETLEHLLGALAGLDIWQVLIEVEGPEVPILDGSAMPFVRALVDARVEAGDVEPVGVTSPLAFEDPAGGRILCAYPFDGLKVSCLLDYPGTPLGTVYGEFPVDAGTFVGRIAPCRTFGFREEVEALLSRGLIRGGGLDNALVIDREGPMNRSHLPFREECLGHKVLDLLGDLALVGRPVRGAFVSIRTGHGIHHRAVVVLRALGGLVSDNEG